MNEKKYKFLLVLIILVGSILRLYRLGTQSFWLDEAYSAMGILKQAFGDAGQRF
jgi:predicted membrane-bound mannosyltransferase